MIEFARAMLIRTSVVIPLFAMGAIPFSQSVFSDEPSDNEPPAAAGTDGARALSLAFRQASKQATPSVVTILAYGQAPLVPPQPTMDENGNQVPYVEPDDQQLTGIGSGVIVNSDGRVITNNHVIARAKRVVVQMADDTTHDANDVKGDSQSDVAVLQLNLQSPAPAAELGDSDTLEIGDWVLAIGSPFRLEATVSAGIISAKNRRLKRIARVRLFQTDAAINPGNSGGPLIDLDGKVIGINTAIATRTNGYQGIGFAIPINQAKWIAEELATHDRVRRAAIGITMAELNPRIAGLFKLTPRIGVLAYEVIEDSAAQKAGVKKYDVVTEFAGVPVRSPGTLQELVEQSPIGSTQSVTVLRNGESVSLDIVMATVEDPTLADDAEPSSEAEKTTESKPATDPQMPVDAASELLDGGAIDPAPSE